jgi:Putative peptidoglycan binding domain
MIKKIASAILFINSFCAFATNVNSQEPPPAEPKINVELIYFDEEVPFKQFHRLSVYRAWSNKNIFYFLPNALREVNSNALSLQYRQVKGELQGLMTVTLEPSFDEDEFKAIVEELKVAYPAGTFSTVEPEFSEWEIQGFGMKKTVSPFLMSNPLLTGTSLTIEVPNFLIRTMLHEGSHYASAFVVRHKFAIRGIELNREMKPTIVTRWFSRGVSFPGGCGLAPERYVNVDTGKVGCAFNIVFPAQYISDVQSLLKELGFYNFKIDGVFGSRTRRAIRNFQKQSTMIEDGQISSLLLDKLRDSATQKIGNN